MAVRAFLLSPANCRGRRTQQLLEPGSASVMAARLREDAGVPIGELFAHLSTLYFRGKLTYARRFATVTEGPGAGVFVITADRGLVPADTPVGCGALREFAGADISVDNPRYRRSMETSASELALLEDTDFVLLGSVASQKYVEVLTRILGTRLTFPPSFVGRGDMSRGGLLLRAAASGEELDYVPILGAVRHGPRPPKLDPVRAPRVA